MRNCRCVSPGKGRDLQGNMGFEPWLSMMDVLGHPKTRVFISRCGGGSVMESLYNGVPVGIPRRPFRDVCASAKAGTRAHVEQD
ncbi:unnamed protein product [Darwinula stevensoni]|uniref:Uncharacterized protein n=1 Tax=Darwinula stevensoni TaxID=69355 RepID=A0A7R8X211_9CRUS|nr:unnamed protein product [Darwinula stevensoni]CAG0880682.1 unnamed protein product [Darwinula stevensoni]